MRVEVAVQGIVQGVGFRPFVSRLAMEQRLDGWVQNTQDGLRMEIAGEQAALEAFLRALRERAPADACIESLTVNAKQAPPGGAALQRGFEVRPSALDAGVRASIPADLAICPECLDEIRNPAARRYRYPFTNCAACGPRFSIVQRLPYDRSRTSMSGFPMCAACAAEYADPADRRYHAQAIACPACGPALQWLDGDAAVIAGGNAALVQAVAALRAGRIVALKGLGGFQLCVDAGDATAIARLRARKRRPHKPFALMFASLAQVRDHCEVPDAAAALLCSRAAPIVLLRRRAGADAEPRLAREVAPDNPYLGVMLAYTPLHYLLLEDFGTPLVCTSGNRSGEPICIALDEARARLAGIADGFLDHDRGIERALDDSVVRLGGADAGASLLRRARGYAPRAFGRRAPGPTVLAFGGHHKNTLALAIRDRIILSEHIGELDALPGVAACERAAADMLRFHDAAPAALACDLHPDYASSRIARAYARRLGVPLVEVQHHHAHVAACMAEHAPDGAVLGLAWDGTGFGTDAAVWGGEALVCTAERFARVGTLRSFRLPGGAAAVREPRRSALALAWAVFGTALPGCVRDQFAPAELRVLCRMLESGLNAPVTTSMGRLFDGVAALAGLGGPVSFDGQAAMALQFAAEQAQASGSDPYVLPLLEGSPAHADWGPLIRRLVAERERGEAPAVIAARFHHGLGRLAVAFARAAGHRQVALAGGCFQNALLSEIVGTQLKQAGFEVLVQRHAPSNDGSLALGQAVVASARIAGQGV